MSNTYTSEQVHSLLHAHRQSIDSMNKMAKDEAARMGYSDRPKLNANEREMLVGHTVAIVAAAGSVAPTDIDKVFEALVRALGRSI